MNSAAVQPIYPSAFYEATGSGITYRIQGGIRHFSGEIRCFGAKNLVSKAMVSSLLTEEPCTLTNVPHTGDVDMTRELLEQVGVRIHHHQDGTMILDPSELHTFHLSMPSSGVNRIPILLLSLLLHRHSDVFVPSSGGDRIGKRPVNFHVQALQGFGAVVDILPNGIRATRLQKRLQGAHITLPYPSVGATETCLFLAVLAEGTSIIQNVALEPEIMELIILLRSMGALIFVNADRSIRIEGVSKMYGTLFPIFGDRLEAASWACLACAGDASLTLKGVRFDALGNFLPYYQKIGGGYELIDAETIHFFRRRKKLSPIHLETDVFPGFSTDWQPPFSVLLTHAEGISMIHDTVHEQRFGHLEALQALGAKVQITDHCVGSLPCRFSGLNHPHSALIFGPTQLHAPEFPLVVPDLRAGLAYLIAAILAEGTTVLKGVELIERGYGNLVERLKDTSLLIERYETFGS